MKFKLKALVAAVVLSATAMSANADISTNNGNSEFVFSAWDADAGVGYTYDLNWDKFLNDLVGDDQFTTTSGNNTLLANAKVGSSLIGSNGVIFDDVLTGLAFAGGSVANAQWNLAAFDSVGRTRLLITQDANGLAHTPSNNQEKAAVTILNAYVPASNGYISSAATDTYALTIADNGAAYAGNSGASYNGNLSDTTNVFGATSNLYFLAQTTQSSSAAASFVQQLTSVDGIAVTAKTYFLNNEWRLQIAAVPQIAPIPEPETYAMLLAGLGLVGAIARRRNKQA
ncbi:PEP-CTERM protein-sorting domain [Methylophilaceae bacterium]